RMCHESVAVDPDRHRVSVRADDGTYDLSYDKLLIGTGGEPIRPPLPGIDLPFIRGVQTLDDAEALLRYAGAIGCQRVVVVGGGYIGLEMAEAFVKRGASSTLLEQGSEVMSTLDPELGALVTAALESHGVDVRLRTEVTGFEPGKVITNEEVFDAD